MRIPTPAAYLCALVAFLAACSSGSSSDGTPTFEPPPTTATPAITPAPTGTVSQAQEINVDNAARLKAIASGKLAQPFQSMEWRADGQAVYLASRQAIFVLQAAGGAVSEVFATAQPSFILDVSSNGKAAVASDVHTIALVDTGPDTVLHTLAVDGTLTAAHFSPDGKILAVTVADAILTQIWDVDTGVKVEDLQGFETAAPVYSVKFGAAGRELIWYSRARAQVMDLVTAQLGPSVQTSDFISAIALSPAEKVLATAAGTELTLWDLENADTLDTFDLPGTATDLAYSPDGKLLFVAGATGVTMLQLPLLTPLGSLKDDTQAVAFSPDGDGLATITRDGVVTIYRP